MQKPERTDEDLHYAARATNAQFIALGHFLRHENLKAVTSAVRKQLQFKQGKTYNRAETKKWLGNAWNTEFVLRQQLELDEEAKRFALQWAFSQAYYACFCQVIAMFTACGQTERSHTTVLKRFGNLVKGGRYPKQISPFADGGMGKILISGVAKGHYPSPLYLELHEPLSVENQVAQLLNSTREKALKEKRDDHKFKTRSGEPRKSLTAAMWATVSDSLGPTTILSILLRKRIKANYREIDTFLRSEISGTGVLSGLVSIVHAFALVHEAIIAAALDPDEARSLTSTARRRYDSVGARMRLIEG